MKKTNDIYLRAYAVAVNQEKEPKRKAHINYDPKWAEHALIFDTETRITPDQSLTFGVYRLCKKSGNKYKLTEDGIFYADDLPTKDREVLERYVQSAIPDAKSFPPQFPLHSRTEFMQKVFWPAIRRGALICGLNLPFDLSRLAVAWSKGEKDEWSLTMARYPDGSENVNYPRVLITPIDSKKAFIKLANPWKPEQWKHDHKSHFLDLRTLLWALFNKSYSLKRACDNQKGPFKGQNLPQKQDYEPTGEVSFEELEYARQDGRCTVALLNAAKQEFDKHPTGLKPYNAYSPASVAKSYLEAMGIKRPTDKFNIPEEIQGIAMQSYYGGRSETRVRCTEVPVVPVDFTSEYPTCCALLGLFEVLTAEKVTFEDDTESVRRFLDGISRGDCFEPAIWENLRFFALVQPDDDILPVRTVYDGVTQNIGNNFLASDTPLWFASCDLIASKLRTAKAPKILRALRVVPHGKQAGMRTVNLRGSMVEIDPYKDDLFRKVIEQRKLNKQDAALYYWLKILANSIYGFLVELIPETQSQKVPVRVFSGEKSFLDSSDVLENAGPWFFPALASLITSAGRLLLAMTEACVQEKKGTYLFCDTDSLAIVSSENGGHLDIPGGDGVSILSWEEVREIVDTFIPLNPYDPVAVKGSILNLVDANFVDSDPKNSQRQLDGYSIAAKRYALYAKIGDTDIEIVDPKAHGIGFLYPPKDSPAGWDKDIPQWIFEMWDYIVRGALNLPRTTPSWFDVPQMMRVTITTYNVLKMLGDWEIARPYNFLLLPMVDSTVGQAFDRRSTDKVLLVCQFSSRQDGWIEMECVNVYDGMSYRMIDCSKEGDLPHNVVIPSQFAHLLVQYQEHPESKSLSPDGTPCRADTRGLLQRVHIVAGDLRFIGKEADLKWGEGDDPSVLEFKSTEYGRTAKVVASEEVKSEIKKIGINRCARESGFDRKNFIRKLVRDIPVRRSSYNEFLRWLHGHESKIAVNGEPEC